jgi:polysaccharide biosynthesis/export protein
MIYVPDKTFKKDNQAIISVETVKEMNRIKTSDELYIQVSSIDQDQYNFFYNQSQSSRIMPRTATEFSLTAYTVDINGYINFPLVGVISVGGLTITEAELKLMKLLTDYLNQPTVKINFVNKSVTILGEVAVPGKYYYSEDYLSIFDALALAGEVEHYANRAQVKVIRENNDSLNIFVIDLTDKDLMSSDKYYLHSKDIVYVELLEKQRWGFHEFPFGVLLQTLTATVLLLQYFKP